MEIIDRILPYTPGEVFHFTPYGCVHAEAELHDGEAFLYSLAKRSQLSNPLFFFPGDLLNLIIPRDEKRFTAHETLKDIAHRTDYINAALETVLDKLRPYAKHIVGIGLGNHEIQIMRRQAVDAVKLVVDDLNRHGGDVRYAGYAGFLTLYFVPRADLEKPIGASRHVTSYTILYHHGRWGGKGGGKVGIQDWADHNNENWDAVVVAHSHEAIWWLGE